MRKPTLKRVRNWTPSGSPRPVVRLVTPLPAFADEPPTLAKVCRSDIQELRRTTYEEEEETLVRMPSSPPPPMRRPAEPSRADEALDALVGAYVVKTTPPPAADNDVDEEPVTEPEPAPAPRLSERRAIVRPSPSERERVDLRALFLLSVIPVALVLDRAVTATEEWLGSLDTKQRVVFIATSAVVASLVTLLVAR